VLARDVSDNPIAKFTAEGKAGPKTLVARNTSLVSMESAAFPDTLRQLYDPGLRGLIVFGYADVLRWRRDLSSTTIEKWGNFTPPTDLSELYVALAVARRSSLGDVLIFCCAALCGTARLSGLGLRTSAPASGHSQCSSPFATYYPGSSRC
jgi:hypothetical protein